MRSEREINKSLKQLQVKASDRLSERVHGDIDRALADEKTTTTPITGRRIMIGSLTKLAAAAAIILAVLIGLNIVETPNSNVAWAQIPDRVASIDTFIFRLTIRVAGNQDIEASAATEAQWVFYLSEEYGFRMDINADGNIVSWYAGPQGDTLTTVIPGEKTWFESPIPEDQRGKMPEEYKDPADYIRRFMARPRKELGRSVIEGTEVEGIEVTDPPTDGEKLTNGVGRMWVDVEKELPVRIEIEGMADGHKVQWLMDFKWSDAVDPSVFEPNIPSDYSSPLP
jgi:outer membrane lipoprotein-sorting protein